MASDPDILSLRSSGRLAVGTQLPRRDDGYFPDAVVKMIDMDLVAHTRPKYELANAKHVLKVSGSEFAKSREIAGEIGREVRGRREGKSCFRRRVCGEGRAARVVRRG